MQDSDSVEVTCPSCGACVWQTWFTAKEMFDGESFRIERCAHCSLARTCDALTPAELARYYHYAGGADASSRFVGVLEPLMRALRRGRVRAVRHAAPSGRRILDVGCGRAVLLQELHERGWEVYGTEVDEAVAQSAQAALRDRIFTQAIEELPLPAASLDVISFWHVLEHLTDPLTSLRRAAELLDEDGIVLVAVPNIDSWQARVTGNAWLHLDVPRHRWHFSPTTLANVAERAGLRMRKIEHFSLEYGPYGWLQSLLAKAGLGHVLFTDVLRPGRRRRLYQNGRAWAHLLVAPYIAGAALASLPAELAAAASRRGGSIVATLERHRSP